MKTVIIAENALEPSTWETHEVEGDLRDFLMERFTTWPSTARIYHHQVAQNCDVTPSDENGIEKLGKLDGTFYVVVYPGGGPEFLGVPWWGWIFPFVGASWAIVEWIIPNVPKMKDQLSGSPTNWLSGRQNTERVYARIPDIYGTVRSYPDLIAVPYTIFEGGREIEYSFMCIGRGSYEYWPDAPSIREDTTEYSKIHEASVEIWNPNTGPKALADWLKTQVDPNATDEALDAAKSYFRANQNLIPSNLKPAYQIGKPIFEPVYVVKRYSGIDGQELKPDQTRINPKEVLQVVYPNIIRTTAKWGESFSSYFRDGDTLTIGDGFELFNTAASIDGTYTILTVDDDYITLQDPASVNSWWNSLGPEGRVWGQQGYSKLVATSEKWTDPVDVTDSRTTEIWLNFVAPQGLFSVDENGTQYANTIVLLIELRQIYDDNTLGAPVQYEFSMTGSAENRKTVAATKKIRLNTAAKWQVRVKRQTALQESSGDTYYSDIQVRDLYGVYESDPLDYGDVTTVRTRTMNNFSARAPKRKFNILVQRKVPTYKTPDDPVAPYTTELYGTNKADLILAAMALDPVNGRRTLNEIDWQNFRSTIDAVGTYFGTVKCTEFGYTFDDTGVSFEEMFTAVANTAFCHAYRSGSRFKIKFEGANPDSILLFNHRNKIPGSETRSINFGNIDDINGIELEWVDPKDEAKVKYTVPLDGSVSNPKKISVLGVRNKIQAHMHAFRAWNKIKYQTTTVEFEATQEADLLTLWDRILVADNTRPDTMDGDVVSQNGLELTLSQDVDLS